MTMTATRNHVDGTVSRLGRDDVTIDLSPDSPGIEISVPAGDIPHALLRYGQPIRMTRHADGGIEYSERPLRAVSASPEEAELDAWIESLG